jgi:hypothetical protein
MMKHPHEFPLQEHFQAALDVHWLPPAETAVAEAGAPLRSSDPKLGENRCVR